MNMTEKNQEVTKKNGSNSRQIGTQNNYFLNVYFKKYFQTRFNRHYSSPKEEARRKNIFLATLKVIRDHNEKYNRHETSWRQGVNQFADLTLIETSYIMIKPQLGTYSGVPEQKPEDQQEHTGNIEKVEDDDEAWQKFKVSMFDICKILKVYKRSILI